MPGQARAKYVLILPDGAADLPLAELDGKTPLEAARTPHADWIAANGRQGTLRTVPDGFSPGSDVATMSLLGYDPHRYHTGRAPLEAAARDLKTGSDDLIFRCNLVTIADGCMSDFTAGHISQPEAARLIAEMNARLGNERVRFHEGVSYRHLMVYENAGKMAPDCTPPHDIPGRPAAEFLPSGPGAKEIREIMFRVEEIIEHHEVNEVRRDLGENPATSIWLWGQGRPPDLPSFRERFGVRGAVIAAVDLVRGLAKCIGWPVIDVEGATGYLDTNYAGKGAAAVAAIDEYDLIMVHVEAPDEAGHLGDAGEKVRAIERVDEFVVGPLLEKIRGFDRWRMAIVPDHPTPVATRIHSADPPPFCMAGTGVEARLAAPFGERNAAAGDLHIGRGHDWMEYFLRLG